MTAYRNRMLAGEYDPNRIRIHLDGKAIGAAIARASANFKPVKFKHASRETLLDGLDLTPHQKRQVRKRLAAIAPPVF